MSELAGANNSDKHDSHQIAPKQPDIILSFVNHKYKGNKEEFGLQFQVVTPTNFPNTAERKLGHLVTMSH